LFWVEEGYAVGVTYTGEQALALAPDPQVARDGKKHAAARYWKYLGRSGEAVWGECQGSSLYQVRVALDTLAPKCSCPSRKQPCKHVIGLLLLALDGGAMPTAEPPAWVGAWLAKRAAAAEPKPSKPAAKKPADAGPSAEQVKRAQRREALVAQGLDTLDLWMGDLMRNGLAAVEAQPATFWERQAAALVDAQARGVATRVRALAGVPGASLDWPDRLLGRLGRLALLSHAYRRAGELDADLRGDVRQLVGWDVKDEEVAERGEIVRDEWLIVGQYTREDEETRVTAQYTWLLGASTGRPALVLQFSFRGAPWKELLLPGVRQAGTLAFWPGAARVRARFVERMGEGDPITVGLKGAPSIEAYLTDVASALGRQPWQERFLCVLSGVTPCYDPERDAWHARDAAGLALPVAGGDRWKLLAVSGGHPVDMAGEWDGEALLPLGVVADGAYHRLTEVA
jgi:hypothetical protein